jgi:flagellar protein FlgJ
MATEISSYYDFTGLSGLRADAVRGTVDEKTINKVSEEFESAFYQMLLDSMKKASEPLKSDLIESDSLDQFQDMFYTEVAHYVSKRHSLGISDWISRGLAAQQPMASASVPQPASDD